VSVTAPPRPPRPDDQRDVEKLIQELELLIEEARARARRRRRMYAACTLAAIAAGAAAYLGSNGGGALGIGRSAAEASPVRVATQSGSGTWGPSHGPEGGNVSAFAVDPRHGSTVFAATEDSLFKSTDGGRLWRRSGLTAPRIFTLAVDPRSSRTIYAGTGGGVFKSVNGGATWRPSSAGLLAATQREREHGLAEGYVSALAIDPQSPEIIYAGTYGGVFKSTNGGGSWRVVNPRVFAEAVAIDPQTPQTVYVGDGRGVFKTTDGGRSWRATGASALRKPASVPFGFALAIDPRSPQTVYAGVSGRGIFKTTNGGRSWRFLNAPDGAVTRAGQNALLVDPRRPQTVYAAASQAVLKSTDRVAAGGS
jgi:photosystem II stability/assembly factor-like uncharacterized protein